MKRLLLAFVILLMMVGQGWATGPYPVAAHGDWPDYAVVPQPDHYWNLNNSLVDSPGSGKDQLDLSEYNNGGSGWSWQNDWAGRSNQAIQTDATNYLLRANHADLCDLGETWTIFLEVYVAQVDIGGNKIFMEAVGPGNNSGVGIQGLAAKNLQFGTNYGNGGWVAVANAFPTTGYYQLVFTLSGGTGTVYINGVSANSGALATPTAVATNGLSFGSRYGAGPLPSGFRFSKIAIIKGTALTPTQVQSLYNTWVDCGSGTYKQYPNNPATGTAPTVTTQAVSNKDVATQTATGNGTIVNAGGGTLSENGIVWATTANPTTSDNKVTSGDSSGAYTVDLTALNLNTTLHARAYAINELGTAYGSDVSFMLSQGGGGVGLSIGMGLGGNFPMGRK